MEKTYYYYYYIQVYQCEVFYGLDSHHTFSEIYIVKWLIRIEVAYYQGDILVEELNSQPQQYFIFILEK